MDFIQVARIASIFLVVDFDIESSVLEILRFFNEAAEVLGNFLPVTSSLQMTSLEGYIRMVSANVYIIRIVCCNVETLDKPKRASAV